MKNSLIHSVMLSFVILLFCASISNAETKSEFSFGNFAVRLPERLQRNPTPEGALLLATTPEGIYPTLNIIEISGKYDFRRPLEVQKKAILHSYKQVGLQSAVVEQSKMQSAIGVPTFTAHVIYHSNKSPFSARIFILPGEQSHYIGTLIHPANMMDGEATFISLLKSIKLIKPVPLEPDARSFPAKQNQHLWLLLLAFILLTTVWLLFGRKLLKRR